MIWADAEINKYDQIKTIWCKKTSCRCVNCSVTKKWNHLALGGPHLGQLGTDLLLLQYFTVYCTYIYTVYIHWSSTLNENRTLMHHLESSAFEGALRFICVTPTNTQLLLGFVLFFFFADCFTLIERVPPFCLKRKGTSLSPPHTRHEKGETFHAGFKQWHFICWRLRAPINCVFLALGRSVTNAFRPRVSARSG